MEKQKPPHPDTIVNLGAPPCAGQRVEHNGKILTTIKEGLAHILVPEDAPTSLDPKAARNGLVESQSVFYNPIQQFNRDLSVLAIKAYGEDLMQHRKSKAMGRKPRKLRGVKRKAMEASIDGDTDSEARKAPHLYHSAENSSLTASRSVEETKLSDGTSVDPVDTTHDVAVTQASIISDDGTIATEQRIETQVPADNSVAQDDQFHYSKHFRILDALSATGLRALRYAQEIPFATSVTANDLSQPAVESIKANVEHNRLGERINPVVGNALSHMYSFVGQSTDKDARPIGRYEVIDLDPYGTAVPFLDAAMHAINDGGLLCVTCTDAGVWASSGYPEKAYSLYGGTPTKGLHSHEGGLRLILHAIASSAARHGMSVEPLLSLSIDFYARVFVRVHRSPAEVKLQAGKTMLVYSCDAGCGAWQTQFLVRNQPHKNNIGKVQNYKHSLSLGPTTGQLCEHCGLKLHLSGPMYGGPLHHPAFIEAILDSLTKADRTTYATMDRLEGVLTTALEETLLDDSHGEADAAEQKVDVEHGRSVPRADVSQIDAHPFFFIPSALAKVLHCRAPPEAPIRGALRRAGYKATRSHCKPGSIRTNASWSFIWEMMREWVRQKAEIKDGAIKPGTPGWGIMRGTAATMAKATTGVNNKHEAVRGETAADEAANQGDTRTKENLDWGAEAAAAAAGGGNVGVGVGVGVGGRGVVFDEKLGRERQSGGRRLVRYQTNPRANWGPMNRAKKGREN